MTGRCEAVSFTHTSQILRGNPLGDPATRDVIVIKPPGYEQGGRAYPVVFWLAGFGSRGADLLGGGVLGETLPARLTRAMRSGEVADALIVLPDCATRYGGSQYLDSAGCGRYQSYLADELVPAIDERFRTRGSDGRTIGGKSSGGYGALMVALQRPGVFDTVCAHSPDAGFEWCYLALMPGVLDTIAARGGWPAFETAPQAVVPKDAAYMVAMSLVAMAACYAAEPGGDLAAAFPCEPDTGAFRDQVWRRWLDHDPVRLAADGADRLRSLRRLYLDVGRGDDYGMHWGARALHQALARAGVPHHYDEHDGGHHGIEHRFIRSLAIATKEEPCVASPAS